MTTTPAMRPPWLRSTAHLHAASAGRACLTRCAGFPPASADGGGGAIARTSSRQPPDLDRNPYRCPQSAQWTVRQHDVAAVRAGDVAGDGKPQPGAAFVLIARVVEP